MIRDFHYITEDFSVRIQYGWIIFKWWQKYIPKDLTEGMLFILSFPYDYILNDFANYQLKDFVVLKYLAASAITCIRISIFFILSCIIS